MSHRNHRHLLSKIIYLCIIQKHFKNQAFFFVQFSQSNIHIFQINLYQNQQNIDYRQKDSEIYNLIQIQAKHHIIFFIHSYITALF